MIDWGEAEASRGHMPGVDAARWHRTAPAGSRCVCVFRELAFGTAGETVIAGSLGQMEAGLSQENTLNAEKANKVINKSS